MTKRIEQNERIKRRFAHWLSNAKGRDEATVDNTLRAIRSYEQSIGFADFRHFNLDLPVQFKRFLKRATNSRTGKPLSHSTIDATLRGVRIFFEWLADQQGYKSRISHADAAYFNNNAKDARVAHARRFSPFPTMEQCAHAFRGMPEGDEYQRRDKAAFALLMLIGARVSALGTLRLKHLNQKAGTIYQDAREVRTKNAKTFISALLPIDPMYRNFLDRWVDELKSEHLFGPADPLFPKTLTGWRAGVGFAKIGLSRECYANSNFARSILKRAFGDAGIPYFNPHSIRSTLTALGVERYGNDPRKFKAWSLNLGHDSIATTIGAYLPISEAEQVELIQKMHGEDTDKRD